MRVRLDTLQRVDGSKLEAEIAETYGAGSDQGAGVTTSGWDDHGPAAEVQLADPIDFGLRRYEEHLPEAKSNRTGNHDER